MFEGFVKKYKFVICIVAIIGIFFILQIGHTNAVEEEPQEQEAEWEDLVNDSERQKTMREHADKFRDKDGRVKISQQIDEVSLQKEQEKIKEFELLNKLSNSLSEYLTDYKNLIIKLSDKNLYKNFLYINKEEGRKILDEYSKSITQNISELKIMKNALTQMKSTHTIKDGEKYEKVIGKIEAYLNLSNQLEEFLAQIRAQQENPEECLNQINFLYPQIVKNLNSVQFQQNL